MVVDFLPVLKHREEVKSTRDAERHPYFYSKTLVNTEKMLESPDFACTLKETKTTIPISRTPKPISGFGLKPGRYRLSAVKVAGFDPLDANHAASTGVGSFPVLDRTCKQGKENTGVRDSQTTRRMPMIMTAMACATASMLAGLTLGPSAPSDRRRSDGVSRELSCKPYLGPILHTIGTAVFIHGTSPKGTEKR